MSLNFLILNVFTALFLSLTCICKISIWPTFCNKTKTKKRMLFILVNGGNVRWTVRSSFAISSFFGLFHLNILRRPSKFGEAEELIDVYFEQGVEVLIWAPRWPAAGFVYRVEFHHEWAAGWVGALTISKSSFKKACKLICGFRLLLDELVESIADK